MADIYKLTISFTLAFSLLITTSNALLFSTNKPYDGVSPLRTLGLLSYDDCLKHCSLKASCKSVVYERGGQFCRLYDVKADNWPTVTEPGNLKPGEYYGEPSWRYNQGDIQHCLSVSCEQGSTCDENGTCVKQECTRLTQNNYINFDGNMLEIGATIKRICVSPFLDKNSEVSDVIVCQKDGEWSNASLSCNCGPPLQIPNTIVNNSTAPLGSNVAYHCRSGYKMNGTSRISTCLVSGQWSTPMFSCDPVDCGTYNIVSNSYLITSGGTTFGHTVRYVCQNGTVSNNASNIAYCPGSGVWTQVNLTCTEIDCGQPEYIENTFINGTMTTYGESVTYTCKSGFENTAGDSDDASSTCMANGDWSAINFACGTPDLIGFSLYKNDTFLLQQQIVIDTYGLAITSGLTLHGCAEACKNETRFCVAISYIATNKTCVLVDRVVNINGFPSIGWYIWTKDIGISYSYGSGGWYSLNFNQAKAYCTSQETSIATDQDIQAAYDLGFNLNQCGWTASGKAVIVLHYPDTGHYTEVGINTCTWRSTWGVFCKQ